MSGRDGESAAPLALTARVEALITAPWCDGCWDAESGKDIGRHKHVPGEGLFTEAFVLGVEWTLRQVPHFGRNGEHGT